MSNRGKSTLIKMLLGKEQPDDGSITIGETVKIVSVGQERMDELNSEKTVFEEISQGSDEIELGTQSVQSRAYLSWFGFKGAQQQAFVGNLSGGERNRVQLAKILKEGGNMIILDEVRCIKFLLHFSKCHSRLTTWTLKYSVVLKKACYTLQAVQWWYPMIGISWIA